MRGTWFFEVIPVVCLLVVSVVHSEQPIEDKKMEPKDIYHLKPKIIEKGEIKVVGVDEVFRHLPNGPIGIDTKGIIPELYSRLYQYQIKNVVDVNMNIAIEVNISWPSFIPYPSLMYQMACCEVNDFCDVPEGLKAVVIPASRYAVVSCESPFDPQTEQPIKSVNYDALLFGDVKWRDDSGRIVVDGEIAREKGYVLKMIYFWPEQVPGIQEYGGAPMYKFELWTAIE